MFTKQTHFFAVSDGSLPWQNACWVFDLLETDVDFFKSEVVKTRREFMQDFASIQIATTEFI
jgi:hypothetical protein